MEQTHEKLNLEKKNQKYNPKYRYCVLYMNALKQAKFCSVLKQALPENRGTVFYPCMECYRRDAGRKIEIQPIFPGYIFIRSDLGDKELHEFIRNNQSAITTFVRELRFSQKKASGENIFTGRNMDGVEGIFPSNSPDFGSVGLEISDLTDEEAEFMDFLLDAGPASDEMNGSAVGENKEKVMPTEGLLKMSYGYQEGNRFKVMKGPLRAYEDHIADVNKHDKKAFLDFKMNGSIVRAGFAVLPKRHWFPKDKDTPEVLADGTEVDLQVLAKAMMG